jgi:MFS family permease
VISSPLAAFLARRRIHYGWVVVGVTFLTMLVTAGAMGAPGVLIVPLEREFGWDNAQISSALALRLLLFGLFGPFAAAFMNRYGLRRVMVWAALLIAAGLLASFAMTQVWQLVVLWGLVVGSAPGSPPSCSPPLWQHAGSRRGAAWWWACCRQARPPGNWSSCR